MSRDILIPDPMSDAGQYERFHHRDIADTEDSALEDELWCLRPNLWGLPAEHWLRERVKALEAEMIKRRGNTGHEFSGRLKLKPAEGVTL